MIFDFTLVLLHKGSILALSVTAYAVPPLPKGEALAKRCTLRGLPRAPTLGELASHSDD